MPLQLAGAQGDLHFGVLNPVFSEQGQSGRGCLGYPLRRLVLAHRHEPDRVRLATGTFASLVDAAANAGEVFLKFGHAVKLHQNGVLRD